MSESHPGRAWPSLLVVILCVLAPPLGLLAWVFGNEVQRATYLGSWWVRAGLTLLLLGSAPLLAIIAAAEVGLWPDPNPNPVGPGLLFFFSGVLATACLVIGVVWGVVEAPPAGGLTRKCSRQTRVGQSSAEGAGP
jgi:hypothetical protein